jgi:hypothetical protein
MVCCERGNQGALEEWEMKEPVRTGVGDGWSGDLILVDFIMT